jgi:hypothetical protein
VKEGWAADIELAGPRYRRGQLAVPCAQTFFFSATVVLMDSTDSAQGNPECSLRGGYHLHPYGEFNLVIPLDEAASLLGQMAGVPVAGRRRRRAAIIFRRSRAALSSRWRFCRQDGSFSTSSRRRKIARAPDRSRAGREPGSRAANSDSFAVTCAGNLCNQKNQLLRREAPASMKDIVKVKPSRSSSPSDIQRVDRQPAGKWAGPSMTIAPRRDAFGGTLQRRRPSRRAP